MKVKSKTQLLELIQEERAWRRKELTNIKSLVHGARNHLKHTVIRASILLLYSHWEGYIKKVTEIFFYYLNFKSIKYSELAINFKSLGILRQFEGEFPYKQFSSYMRVAKFISSDCLEQKFSLDVVKYIDTKSNLNIDVLKDITSKIGIDNSIFENNKFYIDNKLLKLRNSIAHGERTENNPDLYLSQEDFYDLYEKINELMDHFETLVINHVELETYKDLKNSD